MRSELRSLRYSAPRERALFLLARARRKAYKLDSRDPEALHDLRTALRRLRAVLSFHRGLLGRRSGKRLRRTLGKIVRKTGKMRDAQAGRALMEHESGQEERELKRSLGKEARLWAKTTKRLRRRFHGPARELKRFLKRVRDPDPEEAMSRVRRARRSLARSLRHDPLGADLDLLHAARKEVRKLRYAEESLGLKARIGPLKRLQDAMGLARDLSLLEKRARELGLAGLSRRLHARLNRVLKSIPRLQAAVDLA